MFNYLELRKIKDQSIFNFAIVTPNFITEQIKNKTSLNQSTIFLINNDQKIIMDASIISTITYHNDNDVDFR